MASFLESKFSKKSSFNTPKGIEQFGWFVSYNTYGFWHFFRDQAEVCGNGDRCYPERQTRQPFADRHICSPTHLDCLSQPFLCKRRCSYSLQAVVGRSRSAQLERHSSKISIKWFTFRQTKSLCTDHINVRESQRRLCAQFMGGK